MNDLGAVVEVFEAAFPFGGPLLGASESAKFLTLNLQEWGLGGPDEPPRHQHSEAYEKAVSRGSKLIQPPGKFQGDKQKFVCKFIVGLEDDDEFCLVKRILGKAGCNMRKIASDCNAKIRLRGIGSGFLEGPEYAEANMPLQLRVSCTDYLDYAAAVQHVADLLEHIYKHYRRYARSKKMKPPIVGLNIEEEMRDDLDENKFAASDSKERWHESRAGKPKLETRGARAANSTPSWAELAKRRAWAHWNQEKTISWAKSKCAPRGMGLPTRCSGDVQQISPDGQLPIGASASTMPQPAAVPKGTGKGKGPRKRGGRNRGQGGRGKEKAKAAAQSGGGVVTTYGVFNTWLVAEEAKGRTSSCGASVPASVHIHNALDVGLQDARNPRR